MNKVETSIVIIFGICLGIAAYIVTRPGFDFWGGDWGSPPAIAYETPHEPDPAQAQFEREWDKKIERFLAETPRETD